MAERPRGRRPPGGLFRAPGPAIDQRPLVGRLRPWDDAGHASAGHLEQSYDAKKCAGAYAIAFTIETVTHNTADGSTAGCKA